MARRPAHRATTAHLQAAYPFQYSARLGNEGAYIGVDRDTGGAFVYDPFELYRQRFITNPNAIVAGIVGKGKSSLMKTYLWRMSVFGYVPFITDPKGEYSGLSRALGCEPIRLEPGGRMRINPLTRRGGEEGQLALLLAIGGAAVGRPLTKIEEAACIEALSELNALCAALYDTADEDQDAAERRRSQMLEAGVLDPDAPMLGVEPTLPDVAHLLLHPSEQMARELVMECEDVAAQCKSIAFGLRSLCRGPLRGMFDGQTSDDIDLDGPIVVLDLSAVLHDSAIGILMTCATAWMHAQIRAEKAAGLLRRRINVVDEGWRILADPVCGAWLQNSFKLSRDYGLQNIIVCHRFSDLTAAGDEGSRQTALAEGLLSDTETQIILAQPQAEIEYTTALLGLSATEAAELTQLPAGFALWRVAGRSFVVKHELSPREWQLINTDANMIQDRTPIELHDSDPRALEDERREVEVDA